MPYYPEALADPDVFLPEALACLASAIPLLPLNMPDICFGVLDSQSSRTRFREEPPALPCHLPLILKTPLPALFVSCLKWV